MHHHQRSGSGELYGEIAVGHGIQRVLANLFKIKQFGGGFAADGKGGARQRGGAQGHAVHAAAAVCHALVVAPQHFHIGEQMVSEADGLGDLQVGEPRHHGGGVFGGYIHQCVLQVFD